MSDHRRLSPLHIATEQPLQAHASAPVLRKYMPQLDLLRGVAILVVVFNHGLYWSGEVPYTHGLGRAIAQASEFGWLGVNLFFVLSGFLITGILIDTKHRDDYYHRFYWRRVLRILPIYLVTTAVLLTLHFVSWKFVGISLLFLANYAVPLHAGQSFGVFWSLSVEEQFYLLWPTIVRRVSIRTLTWLAAAVCIAEPVLRWMSATHRIPLVDVHTNTALIADNLACGALAAIFVRSRFGNVRYARRWGYALIAAGIIAEFAGIPFGMLHRNTVLGATLQSTPANIFFTGLLLLLLTFQNGFATGIWSAPLRFFGYISYGLYLLHALFFGWYDRDIARLGGSSFLSGAYTRFFLAGGTSVLIAWLSRKYFEDRFLRIKVERGDKQRALLKQAP